VKSREDYSRDYIDSAKRLGIDLEMPTQQITKTAEAAWAIDNFSVEPRDEPAKGSPTKRLK
jgi:hypothetical protein